MGVCSIGRPLAKLQDRGLKWEVEPHSARASWAIPKPVWTLEDGRMTRSPRGTVPSLLSLCVSLGVRRPSVGGEGVLSRGNPHRGFLKSVTQNSLPTPVRGRR